MDTDSIATMDEAPAEELYPYRVMSKAAVCSFGLAFLSPVAFLVAPLLILPLLGTVLGIYGLTSVYRYPDEVSGKILAWMGSICCGLLLVGTAALHAVTYATEVPSGYTRISFADLQPQPRFANMPIPPDALKLNGRQIFVKGYLYPDGQQNNIKRFVLVPDMGTCCFGGQPKLTDMIEVTLVDPLRVEFARRKRALGGVFKVDTNLKPVTGLGGVYYQLTADHLR
jgi:hypothetical protein